MQIIKSRYLILVKAYLIIVFGLGLCLLSPQISSAEIKVLINGNELIMDTDPVIVDGRTLVPLRAIFETLGATVQWDGETKTISAVRKDKTIKLQIDNKSALVNNDAIELDTSATIINGRTMVPVRFIAESLGETVLWDSQKQTVMIGSNPMKTEQIPETVPVLNLVPPRNLQARPMSDAMIRLTWGASPGATEYTVYKSLDGVQYKKVDTTKENSYDVCGLQSQRTYWFKVIAGNGTIVSDYSNVAYDTTLSPPNMKTSLASPAPMGEKFIIYRNDRKLEITLIGLVDGNAAWDKVKKANMFNPAPSKNEMYILAKFRIKVLEPPHMTSGISWLNFELVTKEGYLYNSSKMWPVAGIDDYVEISEDTTEILVSCLVREMDSPRLVLDRGYSSEIWFKLSR